MATVVNTATVAASAAHHVGIVHSLVGSASGGAGLLGHTYELHTCTQNEKIGKTGARLCAKLP
jgi:hypothetical protein